MSSLDSLQEKAINTIRFLSADGVQNANSGHPGLPMGAAAVAYILWMKHLRFNPKNPSWYNRDRFILSGGHGSMLLYSLLYLTGFDLALDELKNFRQWGSRTPGHPEYHLTPGVEVTTGPLGQGFANGVGMAITESHLASIFNQTEYEIVDHFTYAIVTDGDLMEGVASEAASLAGHLKLGKLIYLYDDNRISIDGSTDIAFTEDRASRFESYGWHVIRNVDGYNLPAINSAIEISKKDSRPSLIVCRTHIGYGLPNLQDTAKAHGEPPGEHELALAKAEVGWPVEKKFFVPENVMAHFRTAVDRGAEMEANWNDLFDRYREEYPELANEFIRRMASDLPAGWDDGLPEFAADPKGMATRASSGKILNIFAQRLPELIGGSADLTPSNKTWIEGSPSFQADCLYGRNFHFGVREHGMGAIINGMAVHGGVIPYGGTFLVFSDYMRPAIRLSALSSYPSIWVFTHDSIGLGEDGPTHQPIEHLSSLRAIPNLVVVRPGDANEVRESWWVAINRRAAPTALVFSRQSTPTLDRNKFASASGLRKGAYVLADLGEGNPEIILMASGTETQLIVEAGKKLFASGINVRLISFPSWELFESQSTEYRNSVLLPNVSARLAVEAGVSLGWERWVGENGDIVSIERFGASAPYKEIFIEYGLTAENIAERAKNLKI